MSTPSGTLPALSLAGRLSSNLVRGPLFFFCTGFFGCISLAASCVEEDGRMQHSIARRWARTSLRIAGAPVTVIGRENFLPLGIYTSNHTSFMDTPSRLRQPSLPVSDPGQAELVEVAIYRLASKSVWPDTCGRRKRQRFRRRAQSCHQGTESRFAPLHLSRRRSNRGWQNAALHAGTSLYIHTSAGSAGADGADWHL